MYLIIVIIAAGMKGRASPERNEKLDKDSSQTNIIMVNVYVSKRCTLMSEFFIRTNL